MNHAVSFDARGKFIPGLSSLDPGQAADNAKSPKPPVNADLSPALYRIDNLYEGAKWEPISPAPDNSDNLPWQHLGKKERKLIIGAYLLALRHGSDQAQKLLKRMTTLTGLSNLKQDGNSLQGMNIQKDKSALQSIGFLFQSKA
ncbi:MAG: hypothetical protein PHG36_07845 [Dehalococcoidia bacterium]|nr:hypothetical protein [Dehalococcoidia bacterium]